MKRLAAILASAAFGLAGTAMAADMPIKAAPVALPAVWGWTGCYVGVHVGGAWGSTRVSNPAVLDETIPTPFDPPAGTPFRYGEWVSYDPEGPIGGGQVGCDWQVGQFVLGIEGQFSWAKIEHEKDGDIPVGFGPIDEVWVTVTTEKKFLGTITGRLGWVFGNAMIYGKGGAAWVRDRHAILNVDYWSSTGTDSGVELAYAKETRWGWTAGVGIEYMLTQNWSILAEYGYMNFGEKRVTLNWNTVPFAVPGSPFVGADIEQDVHIAKVGVNYRFGWGAVSPVVAKY